MSTNIVALLAGFAQDCWYDATAFALEPVEHMGIGAIAKRNLEVRLQSTRLIQIGWRDPLPTPAQHDSLGLFVRPA